MCSICVVFLFRRCYSVAILFHFLYCTSLEVYICEFTYPSLHDVVLLSNATWLATTSLLSFTCVGIDYAGGRPEDWRQVEDLFERIRNCGESGGHTDSDACSMYTFHCHTRSGVK